MSGHTSHASIGPERANTASEAFDVAELERYRELVDQFPETPENRMALRDAKEALKGANISRTLALEALNRLKLDSNSGKEFSDRVDESYFRYGKEVQNRVTRMEEDSASNAMKPTALAVFPDTAQSTDAEPVKPTQVAGSPETTTGNVAEQAQPEPTSAEKRDVMKAYMIDMSEVVKAYAWREAEQKLRDVMDTKNFVKKGWVRMGEKGYLMKFYKEALKAIQGNQNLMMELETKVFKRSAVRSTSDGTKRSNEVLDSVIDEYIQEIENDGERGELVNDPEVNLAVAELFSEFSTGAMSRKEFEEKVRRNVVPLLKGKSFSGDSTDASGKGKNKKEYEENNLYANNLYELAQGYAVELDKKIAEYGPDQRENTIIALQGEFSLDMQLGRKERDLYVTKPAPNLKWYEKMVDATQNIPVLNTIIANPVAYGIVGGIVGGQLGKTAGKVALTAGLASIAGIAPWAIPLIIAGGMGGTAIGMRRSRDLQYDRGMDLRRQTLGAESGGKRTDTIREFSYDQKSAEDLTAGLRGLLNNPALGEEGKQLIAEVVARTQVERERQVDLIGVKGDEGEKHKTKLIAMKELRLAMRDVNARFSVQNKDIEEYVRQHTVNLSADIDSNDKSFRSFKFKESVKAGIVGAAFGAVAGAVGQEAFIRGQELFGGQPNADGALSHLYAYITGEKHLVPATGMKVVPVGDHFSIVGNDGKAIAENVTIGPKGMDQTTQDLLASKGIDLKQTLGTSKSTNLSQTPVVSKTADVTQAQSASRTVEMNNTDQTQTQDTSKGVIDGLKDFFEDKIGAHPRAGWLDTSGKEGYTFSLGQEKDGSVAIDAGTLLKNLITNAKDAADVNPDGTVDSKLGSLAEKLAQWSKDGTMHEHIQVAIIPNDEANKEGVSILLAAAGADGKITLPDVLSKLFTNPENLKDGHLPFKFMEVRIDGHVLATASGESMRDLTTTPQIASVPAPVTPSNGEIQEIVTAPNISSTIVNDENMRDIVTDSTFAFSTKKPWEVPPVIPMSDRKQLERRRVKMNAKANNQASGNGTVSSIFSTSNAAASTPVPPELGTSKPSTGEPTPREPRLVVPSEAMFKQNTEQEKLEKILGLTPEEYETLTGNGNEKLTTDELIGMTEKINTALGVTNVESDMRALKTGQYDMKTLDDLLFAQSSAFKTISFTAYENSNGIAEAVKNSVVVAAATLASLFELKIPASIMKLDGRVPELAAQAAPIVPIAATSENAFTFETEPELEPELIRVSGVDPVSEPELTSELVLTSEPVLTNELETELLSVTIDKAHEKNRVAEAVRDVLGLTEEEYERSIKVRRKKTVLASGQVMTREAVSGIIMRIAEHLKTPAIHGTIDYSEILRSRDSADSAVLKTVNGLLSEMKKQAENDISDDKAKDQARKLLANVLKIWKETPPMNSGVAQSPEPGAIRPSSGFRENLVETDPVLAMALHTIYKLEQSPNLTYDDLNAKDKAEGDRKFIELTRELWDEFTTHERPDLDAYSALNIMKLAGMKNLDLEKMNFVKQGDYAQSGSTADSGNMDGTTAGEGGKWIVDDHHHKFSGHDTSATKNVYESRIKFGLLKREEYLDRFVDFVTKCDNADFGPEERKEVLENYSKSLYGLGYRMDVKDILELFKNGVDPKEALSEDYLKKHDYRKDPEGKVMEPLTELSKHIGRQMELGVKALPKLERAGFVFDSGTDRFGKILIDTTKSTAKGKYYNRISGENNSHQLQIFEKGYDAYLIWPSDSENFVLYTKKKMDEESLPGGFSQGFNVRGHMWMKSKNDTSPRTITLDDVLAKLSGKMKVRRTPELERALLIDGKSKELLALFDEGTLTENILRNTAGKFKIYLIELLEAMISQRSGKDGLNARYNQKKKEKLAEELKKKGVKENIALGVLLSSMKTPSVVGTTPDVQVPDVVSAVSPVSEPRKPAPEKKVVVESEEDRDRRVAIQDVLGVTEQEYKTFFKRNRQSMKHDEVADVIVRIADTLGDLNQRRDTGDYATFLKEKDAEQQRATKLYNEMRKRVRSAITEVTTQRSALNLLENAFMKWNESTLAVSKQQPANVSEPIVVPQPQSTDIPEPVPATSEPLPPSAPAPETEPEPIAPNVESIDLEGLGIPEQFGKFELTRDSLEKSAKKGKVTIADLATAFVESSPELKKKYVAELKNRPGDIEKIPVEIILNSELVALRKNVEKMENENATLPEGKKKNTRVAKVEKMKKMQQQIEADLADI